MNYKNVLVTGGAGFVGSNISIKLKQQFSNLKIIALDNLVRRGSELNVARLKKNNVHFVHGDVRNKEDLAFKNIDLIIECSAEPSIMAGVNGSPEYLMNTNLNGAINCFELARKNNSHVVFLSSSRVYPVEKLNAIPFKEEKTRFSILSKKNKIEGLSERGISELFSMQGSRTLYGSTKYCAEILLEEYRTTYNIRSIINRYGLISGPWQMGKVDQGVIVYWLVNHFLKRRVAYFGFGGKGKQVRDVLHIDDLFELLLIQLQSFESFSGEIFNVGGGLQNSVSLYELTLLCQEITGNRVDVVKDKNNRKGDVRIYVTDNKKASHFFKWKPKKNVKQTLQDIHHWLQENQSNLDTVFS